MPTLTDKDIARLELSRHVKHLGKLVSSARDELDRVRMSVHHTEANEKFAEDTLHQRRRVYMTAQRRLDPDYEMWVHGIGQASWHQARAGHVHEALHYYWAAEWQMKSLQKAADKSSCDALWKVKFETHFKERCGYDYDPDLDIYT